MCLAVYTVNQDERVDCLFAFERVFQGRKGSSTIVLDCLIHNRCFLPINRLRIVLPYQFADVQHLIQKCTTTQQATKVLPRLRQEELKKIRLKIDEFAAPNCQAHWPYHGTVPDVTLDLQQSVNGRFVLQRPNRPHLAGVVKRGWILEFPPRLDDWLWFLFAANHITILDVALPSAAASIEQLQPNEAMWLRLEIEIPATGYNKKRWYRTFMPTNTYRESFSSSRAVSQLVRAQMQTFEFIVNQLNCQFMPELRVAINSLKQTMMIPPDSQLAPEIDSRIFSYREYGLTVVDVTYPGAKPARPLGRDSRILPYYAYPPRAKLGPWPPAWNRILSRRKYVLCDEFWIGTEHGCTNPNGYAIRVVLQKFNHMYTFFAWSGFLAFLMKMYDFVARFA